jgi:hypothetical protein
VGGGTDLVLAADRARQPHRLALPRGALPRRLREAQGQGGRVPGGEAVDLRAEDGRRRGERAPRGGGGLRGGGAWVREESTRERMKGKRYRGRRSRMCTLERDKAIDAVHLLSPWTRGATIGGTAGTFFKTPVITT